jgi:tyrosyl-tRNA synthetase
MNALAMLEARGFVQQCTNRDEVQRALDDGAVTFYIGFDPTASSLHVGSLLQIMVMAWLQRYGHRPIAIIGAGTTLIGDPTGRTELRKMLSAEEIEANGQRIKNQIEHFLDLDGEKGLMLNNAEWLTQLNYLSFLRDIGKHFSVNRMMAAEGYKQRLARGLSFIEFNYQILQAYDFLELYRRHGCTLQIGGDDQWGNIIAGSGLIRRCDQGAANGLTTPLITTSSGAKMGKTAKGAVWLDPALCSPFDFYQFWLNVDDADVIRFLKLYTFLDLEEIETLAQLRGADIRKAKRVLARQITSQLHGEDAMLAAESAAANMTRGVASADMQTHAVGDDAKLVNVLADANMEKSRGAARRLMQGGAVRVNGEKVTDVDYVLSAEDLSGDGVVVRLGKKRAIRLLRES